MFTEIQILSTLFIIIGVYWYSKNSTLKMRLTFSFLTLLFSVLSNNVLNLIPMPMEELTISALGEKGTMSNSDEIVFSGFLLEGEPYSQIEVLNGKWFWAGENYMWRNETDSRQPEGTTREIVVAVPMGSQREAVFSVSQWRGRAEIKFGDQIQVVDFSPGNETNIKIPDSNLFSLRVIKLIRLLGYLFSVLAFSFTIINSRTVYLRRPEKYQQFFEGKKFYLIISSLCVVQFLFFLEYAGVDGFWYDELFIIGFSIGDGTLFGELFPIVPSMPFVVLLERIIYRLMPYGEKWLLVPYMVSTIVGMYFTALAGKRLAGKKVGILCIIFMLFSKTIVVQLAYEVRSYAFYFMGAAILLFLYLKRLEHMGEETRRDIVIFSIAMAFFSQMHYFAIVICIGFFLIDFTLYFHKRIKIITAIPYIVSAIFYIPSCFVLFKSINEGKDMVTIDSNNWQPIPSTERVIDLLKYLINNNEFAYILLILGIVLNIVSILKSYKSKKNFSYGDIQKFTLIFIPSFLIFFMYIYGVYIKPDATLWMNRYFVGLIPFLITLICSAFAKLCHEFQLISSKNIDTIVLGTLLMWYLPSAFVSGESAATTLRQPFRESAQYLYQQVNHIYNDSTLIISTSPSFVTEGWNEYYLTQQGKRDGLNMTNQFELETNDLLKYERIYVSNIHLDLWSSHKSLIEENFNLLENNSNLKVMTYVRK